MLVKRAEEKRGLLDNEDGEFHQIKKVFIRHWQQSVIRNNQSSSVHTTWFCKTQLYLTVWLFLGIAVERTSRPGEKFGWLDLRWFSYHSNIFYNRIRELRSGEKRRDTNLRSRSFRFWRCYWGWLHCETNKLFMVWQQISLPKRRLRLHRTKFRTVWEHKSFSNTSSVQNS